MNIIKCIIGFCVFFFGFYMFLYEYEIRSTKSKLTKREKRYFNILEIWFYITVMIITGEMIYPLIECFN
jgi:hypothetical protein